jgi:hypothetical protein
MRPNEYFVDLLTAHRNVIRFIFFGSCLDRLRTNTPNRLLALVTRIQSQPRSLFFKKTDVFDVDILLFHRLCPALLANAGADGATVDSGSDIVLLTHTKSFVHVLLFDLLFIVQL